MPSVALRIALRDKLSIFLMATLTVRRRNAETALNGDEVLIGKQDIHATAPVRHEYIPSTHKYLIKKKWYKITRGHLQPQPLSFSPMALAVCIKICFHFSLLASKADIMPNEGHP